MVVEAVDANEIGVEMRMMVEYGSTLTFLYSIQAGEVFRLGISYLLSRNTMILFTEWPP